MVNEFQDRSIFLFELPTDAMLWIKEVQVAESVDDLMTSQSIGGNAKLCGFLSNSFARSASLPVLRNTSSHGADAILLKFPKKADGSSLGASKSSKKFPDMPSVFRV